MVADVVVIGVGVAPVPHWLEVPASWSATAWCATDLLSPLSRSPDVVVAAGDVAR